MLMPTNGKRTSVSHCFTHENTGVAGLRSHVGHGPYPCLATRVMGTPARGRTAGTI